MGALIKMSCSLPKLLRPSLGDSHLKNCKCWHRALKMILSDDNLSLSGRYRDAYLKKNPCNMEAIISSRLGKFLSDYQENVQWNSGKWWGRVRLTSRPVVIWVLIPEACFHKAGEFLCFCHPHVPCGNPGPGCCSGLTPLLDPPSESLLIGDQQLKTKTRHLLFISQCVFFNRQTFLRAEGIYTAFLCLQHTANTGIYISKEVCWFFFFQCWCSNPGPCLC